MLGVYVKMVNIKLMLFIRVLNERTTDTIYDHEDSRDHLKGQQKHSEVKHF